MDRAEPIIKTKVTSTQYLYGVKPTYFANMKYQKILEEKIKLAKSLASKLYDKQRDENDKESKLEIEYKLNNIYRAIDHNEQLLREFIDCSKRLRNGN